MSRRYYYSEITCKNNTTNSEIIYTKEFDGLSFAINNNVITIHHYSKDIDFYSIPVCAVLNNYSVIKTKLIEITP